MNVRKASQALSARFYLRHPVVKYKRGGKKQMKLFRPVRPNPEKAFSFLFSCHAGDFGLPLCCWILIFSSFWPCACPV